MRSRSERGEPRLRWAGGGCTLATVTSPSIMRPLAEAHGWSLQHEPRLRRDTRATSAKLSPCDREFFKSNRFISDDGCPELASGRMATRALFGEQGNSGRWRHRPDPFGLPLHRLARRVFILSQYGDRPEMYLESLRFRHDAFEAERLLGKVSAECSPGPR